MSLLRFPRRGQHLFALLQVVTHLNTGPCDVRITRTSAWQKCQGSKFPARFHVALRPRAPDRAALPRRRPSICRAISERVLAPLRVRPRRVLNVGNFSGQKLTWALPANAAGRQAGQSSRGEQHRSSIRQHGRLDPDPVRTVPRRKARVVLESAVLQRGFAVPPVMAA